MYLHVCAVSVQMAQVNPTVRLYVVTVDGSSRTTELRPPDSFEKRLDWNIWRIVDSFAYSILPLFPQWSLHHHGEMGRTGEAERALGESSPEHVDSLTLRCCDRRLYNGKNWRIGKHAHSTSLLVSFWLSRKTCWRQRSGWIVRWWRRSLSLTAKHLFKEKNNQMFPGLNGVSFPQNEEPLYSRDCRTFFITVPLKHSHHGTFRHINMISDRVRLLQTLFSRHFVALTKERKPDFLLMTKLVCLHGPEYPGDDWISENIIKLPWYLGKVERILCPYFIWWGINKTSIAALNRVYWSDVGTHLCLL